MQLKRQNARSASNSPPQLAHSSQNRSALLGGICKPQQRSQPSAGFPPTIFFFPAVRCVRRMREPWAKRGSGWAKRATNFVRDCSVQWPSASMPQCLSTVVQRFFPREERPWAFGQSTAPIVIHAGAMSLSPMSPPCPPPPVGVCRVLSPFVSRVVRSLASPSSP